MLKWEATILNRLYETTLFDQIVLPTTAIEAIDYVPSLEIYKAITKPTPLPLQAEEFLEAAHLLCKSKLMEEKRDKIIFLNEAISLLDKEQPLGQPFGFFHVIVFSGLSKCSIWPGMFKTSLKLVPSLIGFYSRFHSQFKQFLEYKFDPLILSSKFTRIVKHIKDKRLANPQLFDAVAANDLQKIRQLGEQDPQILNECVKEGLYLTHHAAVHSDLETLRLLLALGANFELLDLESQTPIFYAVKRFDLQIVRFFVEEARVNVNHTECQNRTPIYLAAFEGKLDIVDYLYSRGADPEIESKLARTPLSKACYLGNVGVVEYLIRLGVRIEAVDSKGRTALHNAAWGIEGGREGKRRGHIRLEDSPECIELLLKAGHRVDFEDYDKFTPLFSAISSHAERSLQLLVHHGANLKHKTVKNETGVFIACKYGHAKMVHILVEEFHCDFLEESSQGYSPLAASLTRDEPECSWYMLDLYINRKVPSISLKSLWKCLIEYKKVPNCTYVLQWFGEEQNLQRREAKEKYLAQNVDEDITELLDFVVESGEAELKEGFFKLLQQIQAFLSFQSIESLFQFIETHSLYTDQTLRIILTQSKRGHPLCRLVINPTIHENTVLELLSLQSNLNQNLQHLYRTFLTLIELRYTKAILYILRGEGNQSQDREILLKSSQGIDLISLLYSKVEGGLSIADYCLVHGHHDIHKIISAFYQKKCEDSPIEPNFQERPVIPKYKFRQIESKEVKSYLFPVEDLSQKLNFHFLASEYLSESDRQLYQEVTIRKAPLKVVPILVRSQSDLQTMICSLSQSRMVGIDVEHYSCNDESFICLIQLATFDSVFVVDRFNSMDQQLHAFLAQLFRSPHILKIFHSYDNDLKWLVEDYQIEEFQTVLDTAKVYALLEPTRNQTPSLKMLAQQFLNFEIRKEFQKSDWRIRPLFREMLEYAGTDAKVLPYLLLKMLESSKLHSLPRELLKPFQGKRMVKSSIHRNEVLFA